jgi:transcriptional regulator
MGGNDLFTGTLELLVLRVLATGPEHGFGIGRILREHSSGVLDVAEGVLYPALHRLENRGLLESEWRRTPAGRRAKVYALTPDGSRRLDEMEADWARFRSAVASIHPRTGEASS